MALKTRKLTVEAITQNDETCLVLAGRTFRLADLENIRKASDAVTLGIPVDYLRPFTGSWCRYWQWLGQLLNEQVHGTH